MRRKLLVSGAAVALGGAVAGVVAWGSGGKEMVAAPALPPATANVVRTTLVETKTVSGTLGYGEPRPVRAAATGTITWIAPVGATVKRGAPLFKIDERPVIAFYGSLPLYRTLREGTKGRDVRELERNLAALGYSGFPVNEIYTSATAAAVRAWQGDLRLPKTGTVEPGRVVFTPGAARIAAHAALVGDTIGRESAEGALVLSYTSTTKQVTVELEVADEALARKGRAVTVKVPGRRAVRGRIARVGTVINAQAGATDAGAPPDQGAASANTSSATSNARIEVTVAIADQKGFGFLDAAPADVDFVSNKREGVLAVPVAALLALAKGGFGVQVVDGDRTRIVAVKTGMFAAGRVEVSGQGIAPGVAVGVPK